MAIEHDSVVLLGYLFVLLQGLGLLAAVHAVLKVRTAQGAVAWIVALLAFLVVLVVGPMVGLICASPAIVRFKNPLLT